MHRGERGEKYLGGFVYADALQCESTWRLLCACMLGYNFRAFDHCNSGTKRALLLTMAFGITIVTAVYMSALPSSLMVHIVGKEEQSSEAILNDIRAGRRRVLFSSRDTAAEASFHLLLGAEEALRVNPPLYLPTPNNEQLFKLFIDNETLVFVEADQFMIDLLHYWADNKAEAQCHLFRQDIFTDVPLRSNGLAFAPASPYIEAFSVAAAERYEFMLRSTDITQTLPPQCAKHFETQRRAEIRYMPATLRSFSGVFAALTLGLISTCCVFYVELVHNSYYGRHDEKGPSSTHSYMQLKVAIAHTSHVEDDIILLMGKIHNAQRMWVYDIEYR